MPSKTNDYYQYVEHKKDAIRDFYDHAAVAYHQRWIPKNTYYYDQIKSLLQSIIPPGKRVLDAGCGTGHMLAAVQPAFGVGIDFSSRMISIASRQYPNFSFKQMSIEESASLKENFDFVISCNSITEITDLYRSLKNLYQVMTPESRLVIVTYNYMWEPILTAGAYLGLRPHRPAENWFSYSDLHNILVSADFEIIRHGYRTMVPKNVPLLAPLCNTLLVRMPGLRHLGVTTYFVARPLMDLPDASRMSVSVVVPCKNEEGNIEGVVDRTPSMGKNTEIIFVDDKSTDATATKIQEQIRLHPEKKIRMVSGPGQGKGAACRAGFAVASNDVLMILDADMTVMPEVLPDFFMLIAAGKGEFINGSRLLYPMEDQAMRTANVIGNKFFAMLFTFLLEQPIKDTLCGTKVLLRRDYHKILETRAYLGNIDRWGDYDWIFGAARHNLKILEFPVHYVRRVEGESKMTNRLRNAWIMLKMCWAAFTKLKLQ